MSERHVPKRVPNYTTAFLVSAGAILFMAFFTLAATAGFVWVVLSAALIDAGLRLAARPARTGRRED